MANPSAQSRKRAAPGSSAPVFDNLNNIDFPQLAAANHYYTTNMMQPNHMGALTGRPENVISNPNNQLIVAQRNRNNGTMVSSSSRAARNNVSSGNGNGNSAAQGGAGSTSWDSRSSNEAGVATAETDTEVDGIRDSAMRIADPKSGGRKQIPPFVQKLAQFVNDPKCDDVIRWSDNGKSFLVLDEDAFSKNLIPDLFKHNNYASFVRQLNMYGFHKVVALSDGSMKTAEQRSKPVLEYTNPYFQRDQKDLLWLIRKPKSGNKKKVSKKDKGRDSDDENSSDDRLRGYDDTSADIKHHMHSNLMIENGPPRSRPSNPQHGGGGGGGGGVGGGSQSFQSQELANILQQLEAIKQHQSMISSAISRLRKDNQALYEQAVAFQSQHDRHENSINHILSFLATVYDKTLGGHLPAPFVFNAVGTPTVSPPVVPVGNPRGLIKRQPLLLENGPVYQAQTARPTANKVDFGNAPFPKMPYSAQNYNSEVIQELKSSPRSAHLMSPVNTIDTPVTASDTSYAPSRAQFPVSPLTPNLGGTVMSSPRSRQQSIQSMRPALDNYHEQVSGVGDQLKNLQTHQKAQDMSINDLERMLHSYVEKQSPGPGIASPVNVPAMAPTGAAAALAAGNLPTPPTPPASYMPDDLANDPLLFGGVPTPDMGGFDWNAISADMGNDHFGNSINFGDFTFPQDEHPGKITSAGSSPETVDDDGREMKKQRRG